MKVILLAASTLFVGIQIGFAQCAALNTVAEVLPVVKIELAAKQIPARVGSALWVEVTITNPSDRPNSFWKNTNTSAYPIEVSDEAGRPLTDKRPGFRRGRFDPTLVDPTLVDGGELIKLLSGSLVCVTLKPGESSVDRIDVSRFYNMSAPGTYTIAVEGYQSAKADAARASSIKVRRAR